ncbi:MAG TPA: lysylphosphatidylglycerol synthase transmembrane domain-containing protein [Anaerolineae bacterium]|nr:lysylphosphatidylglycerol synthase transmembrane domain-containing protein [Anaerolineae bacterium]
MVQSHLTNNKRRWQLTIQIITSIILVGLIFYIVKPYAIWQTLRNANFILLLLSLPITLIIIGLKSTRWWLLTNSIQSVPFTTAIYSFLIGLALATITPLAAGEAGRAFFIPSIEKSSLTGKFLLDKLVDLSAVFLFSSIGLAFISNNPILNWISLLLIILLISSWLLMYKLVSKLRMILNKYVVWADKLFKALENTTIKQLLINVVLAFISFVFFYGQLFLILQALWPTTTWSALIVFPIITLSTILPLAIGGVGIREWSAIILLSEFGIPHEVAVTATFTHFIIVQFIPAILGAILLTTKSIQIINNKGNVNND